MPFEIDELGGLYEKIENILSHLQCLDCGLGLPFRYQIVVTGYSSLLDLFLNGLRLH